MTGRGEVKRCCTEQEKEVQEVWRVRVNTMKPRVEYDSMNYNLGETTQKGQGMRERM